MVSDDLRSVPYEETRPMKLPRALTRELRRWIERMGFELVRADRTVAEADLAIVRSVRD